MEPSTSPRSPRQLWCSRVPPRSSPSPLPLDWVDVTSGLYLFAVVCGADDEQERMAVAERWRNEVVTTDSEEGVSANDKGLLSLSEEGSGLLLIFVN